MMWRYYLFPFLLMALVVVDVVHAFSNNYDGMILRGHGHNNRITSRSSKFDVALGYASDPSNSIIGETTKWKGSSYSWTPPSSSSSSSRISRNNENNSNNRNRMRRKDRLFEIIDFPNCGSVQIHQQPSASNTSNTTTGVVLWSAARSLADYIDDQAAKYWMKQQKNSTTLQPQRPTCLEFGAGLGLPSIIAARHGFHCIVTESDPIVLPLLHKNLQTNLDQRQQQQQQVQVTSFNWTNPTNLHNLLSRNNNDQTTTTPSIDLIIASDLIYKDTKPVWEDLIARISEFRYSSSSSQQQHQEDRNNPPMMLRRYDDGSKTTPSSKFNDPLVLLGYTHRTRNLSLEEERYFFQHLLPKYGMKAYPIPHTHIPNNERHGIFTTLFELRWI